MATGEKIRDRREELGMSKTELARKIGVHKSTITRYEADSIDKIPYLTFIKILIALQTTPDRLLSDDEKELVAQADELSGRYKVFETMQEVVAQKMSQLSEDDLSVIDAVAQGLLSKHKE
jgi:transcriptional regulator with XRE-family HTH domain